MIFINNELGLGKICKIFITNGLYYLIFGINHLRLNAKARRIGRVCLLPTALIIRRGGKLLCQLLKRFMLFGWCELGGIWGFEGLDRKNRGEG
jgi:hypothetical protein